LQEELTCTIAGTSSSTSFSYSGYHHLSVSGGSFQCPPEGVRVQVAADEAEFLHAALEFRDAVGRRDAWRLRQLADGREIRRVEGADAVDQLVALARPGFTDLHVADMVLHGACARRKEREVRAALALHPELRAFQRIADLLIGDLQGSGLLAGNLLLAPVPEGCGAVV
jgi:hypothetical protein